MGVVMAWNGYMLPPQTDGKVMAPARRFVGRRKLCFDEISSVCSSSDTHHDDDSISFKLKVLQSYLSDLTIFLAPDSKTFYVQVDNRPWLEDLASWPAHLWQLMVTKSRMSLFANTRGKKGREKTKEFIDHKVNSKASNRSQSLKKWFSVVDAATLSKKRALLPVKKLRYSLLANSKLHRTLYGFIVFQVEWKDVRGINYLNELQTDTSLAIKTKNMKRWECDSISQSVKCINPWFPGTPHERSIVDEHLNSMLEDEFHDAPKEFPNYPSTNDNEKTPTATIPVFTKTPFSNEKPHTSQHQTTIPHNEHTPPHKRRKLTNSSKTNLDVKFTKIPLSYTSGCDETTKPTESKDVLLLFRFNNRNLPFKLKEIIVKDLRLLTLLEAGLPS